MYAWEHKARQVLLTAHQVLQATRPPRLTAAELMELSGMPPDPWQLEFFAARPERALLLCGRQTGKSTCAAACAVEEMICQAPALVLCVSPTLRQSQELFRKIRELFLVVRSQVPILHESALRIELLNGSRGISLPGSETTIRGYSRAALVLVDESAYLGDGVYRCLRPMLATSGGRMICATTPFGARGFFYESWVSDEPWYRAQVNASECPRIPATFLEEEARALGPWYAQEYENAFLEDEFAVFAAKVVDAAVNPAIQPLFSSEETSWANILLR